MPAPPITSSSNSPPQVHFDWTEWLGYMDDSNLTDAQKQEMIETLWSIVLTFVDLGWEVSATPQEISGQIPDLRAALAAAVVNSRPEKEEVCISQKP